MAQKQEVFSRRTRPHPVFGRSPMVYIAGDVGNAQIKAVSSEGTRIVFPHALVELSAANLKDRETRSDYDNEHVYDVNGTLYAVGDYAIRDGAGAARLGEARYVETYYGVLAAIAMHKLSSGNARVFWYGSHTPKDIDYRQDLVASVVGREWKVVSGGVEKRFWVEDARGFDEPTGLYRDATLGSEPGTFAGDKRLRSGECLIIDVGGFTTAFSVAIDGKVDYASSLSEVTGILDVLKDFERLIRGEYRLRLKGTNRLNAMKLRDALKSGEYDAGIVGKLPVKHLAEQAVNPLLRTIEEMVNNYGGLGSFNSVLVGGGGGALLESRLRARLTSDGLFVPKQDRSVMHFATADGGMKTLLTLQAAGKL